MLRMALPSDARLAWSGLSGPGQATKQRYTTGVRKGRGEGGGGESGGKGYKGSGGGDLDLNTVVDID